MDYNLQKDVYKRQHISNIRKKIKTVTSEEYIETVWGIGYRLHV